MENSLACGLCEFKKGVSIKQFEITFTQDSVVKEEMGDLNVKEDKD